MAQLVSSGDYQPLVNVITESKACDTAGAQTDAGYPSMPSPSMSPCGCPAAPGEGAGGADRHNDHGVGPCVTSARRSATRAHADAAISIHADGGPPNGTGFEVIAPGRIAGAPDAQVIGPWAGSPWTSGTPTTGSQASPTPITSAREDSTCARPGRTEPLYVPKVFIECGNMRNAADAARLTSPRFRERVAVALAAGFTAFLNRHS